jgi:ribonucleoside-diphosphate reductase beta chain
MRLRFNTSRKRLNRQNPAFRLWEKGKRLGTWNPSDLDFRRDREEWLRLAVDEQDIILRLSSLFQAGEEAVTVDLLPLISVIAAEGRLEEELYLTNFLFEEGKHTDFFDGFVHHVAGAQADLTRYHTDNYRTVFYEVLPEAMSRLKSDPSPAAQVRAAVTYNLVVEGMLAETGYHAFFTMLTEQDLLPACRQGIALLKRDDSRHIAYGIFLLSRLIAVDDTLWGVVEETVNELFAPALGIISEGLAPYDPPPFGLVESDFLDYASRQFEKRIDRIERARGADLASVLRLTARIIEEDDA